MVLISGLACLGSTVTPPGEDTDPVDLVKQSIEAERANRAKAASYLYTEDITRTLVDGDQVLEKNAQRYEVIFLAGEPYYRLVGRDGSPLSPEEEDEERRRMETVAADRRAGRLPFASPAERPRVSIVYHILPEFHQIRLVGAESMQGRDTWKVEASPHRSSNSGGLNDKETRAMRVTIWIDKETFLRVRQDAEVTKKVGRLDKGSSLSYRFAPQPDGVWLVREIIYRTPLGKSKDGERYRETDQVYSNYHKFQAESNLVPGTVKE
jgi:hypothetical protein